MVPKMLFGWPYPLCCVGLYKLVKGLKHDRQTLWSQYSSEQFCNKDLTVRYWSRLLSFITSEHNVFKLNQSNLFITYVSSLRITFQRLFQLFYSISLLSASAVYLSAGLCYQLTDFFIITVVNNPAVLLRINEITVHLSTIYMLYLEQ